MSKPTGIHKKQPTKPKIRALFRPRTRPEDHGSSIPRTEPMSDADQQSSPAPRVTPDLGAIPGLVGTPEEPDSQGTATSGEYGSDTEEEDNTELENYYLNKKEETERRIVTVSGDALRVWKSFDGTWYTCFEGEVIDGQSYLPARYRQPPYKESVSADRHSSSEVHTAVAPSNAVEDSVSFEQSNAFKQPNVFDQSNNAFRQTNAAEQPTAVEQPTAADQSVTLNEPTTRTHPDTSKKSTKGNYSGDRNIIAQLAKLKHSTARSSPTKSIPRTSANKVTKPNKVVSRTPDFALPDALARRTRDDPHLSTIFHYGSAAIKPLGTPARPIPHNVAPPSRAPLVLKDQPVANQQAPRSAVAHLAHGGSPAARPASPTTSHVSTASARRITFGSFGTFERSPGRFDERKYRHLPAGTAATNSAVDDAMVDVASDDADSTAGSFSSSPAKADRGAWLRGRKG